MVVHQQQGVFAAASGLYVDLGSVAGGRGAHWVARDCGARFRGPPHGWRHRWQRQRRQLQARGEASAAQRRRRGGGGGAGRRAAEGREVGRGPGRPAGAASGGSAPGVAGGDLQESALQRGRLEPPLVCEREPLLQRQLARRRRHADADEVATAASAGRQVREGIASHGSAAGGVYRCICIVWWDWTCLCIATLAWSAWRLWRPLEFTHVGRSSMTEFVD
mmetsp:Transcript_170575/g.547132  ORF Transcript_170575/g.547132 Transcript_170575/m.547132 type:complete len:220 (+) Transcript_170575:1217-1876(+)